MNLFRSKPKKGAQDRSKILSTSELPQQRPSFLREGNGAPTMMCHASPPINGLCAVVDELYVSIVI